MLSKIEDKTDEVKDLAEEMKENLAVESEPPPPEPELSPEQKIEKMDNLLKHAFFQAWRTTAKKAEMPMLTSNFFR